MDKVAKIQLCIAALLALGSQTATADTYLIYMPSTMPGMIGVDSNGDSKLQASEMYTNKKLIITNTDSRTVTSMSLTDYLQKSATDSYVFGSNDTVQFDGTTSSNRVYQEFKGSTLTIRENGMLQVRDKGADGIDYSGDEGNNRTFDRILKLDVTTGKVTEQILIAKTQSDYDYATAKGYKVTLEATGETSGMTPVSMTTYSQNLTNSGEAVGVETVGNFSTNKITSADGNSLFRQESDGTVHIGENSIVFADESISASGTDEIYSSSGTLQLGSGPTHQTNVKGNLDVSGQLTANNLSSSSGTLQLGNSANHKTVIQGSVDIRGNITVPDPTSPTSAANKRYVDGAVATALAMGAVPKAPRGGNMFGVATGYHAGQSAIALGLSMHDAQRNMLFNLSAGYNTTVKDASIAAGVGWGF